MYIIDTYTHMKHIYIHTNIIYTQLYTWPEVHRNVRKAMKPLKYFPTEMRRREEEWRGSRLLFRGFHNMSCFIYTYIHNPDTLLGNSG